MICGHCENWRCDDPLHLAGHCAVYRTDEYKENYIETCPKYKSIYSLDKLKSFGEKEGNE